MTNGIYTDITIQDYHANKTHISSTGIKYVKQSLKHFEWFTSGKFEQPEKLHLSFGNAFELALLDKTGFNNEVAIEQTEAWEAMALEEKPELKVPKLSKAYTTLREKFLIENKGKYKIPDVGQDSFETIEAMLTSCYQDATVQKLIEGTEYQTSLFWTDPETGINLKTRPDMNKRKKNVIVNLKTTLDGSPKAFSRDMVKWNYPLQAAIEIEGCLETGLMPSVDHYFWLVFEKLPPYCATIYSFGSSDRETTKMELRLYLSKIEQARKHNLWPGYSERSADVSGILEASLPAYY